VSDAASSVSVSGADLDVTLSPRVGGTITSIRHRSTGLEVLGQVPWTASDLPIASGAARDESEWLTRYSGGWPLLFPNGGDACTVGGVFHGFHGEASISPWSCKVMPGQVLLWRRFYTVPVEMHRCLRVNGNRLVITERLHVEGKVPVDVMWGHHPTFGSDLLAGTVEITCGGGKVSADTEYDPQSNPLEPDAVGAWPGLAGKKGPFDLGHPRGPMAALAYLHDLREGWIALRRLDNSIAAILSWDKARFPCLWLWYELGGTREAPWFGRANLIGLEPNTSMPASGLVKARARGASLLRLSPGENLSTTISLQVLKPQGAITSIDAWGPTAMT
jgi:hypothetical protein